MRGPRILMLSLVQTNLGLSENVRIREEGKQGKKIKRTQFFYRSLNPSGSKTNLYTSYKIFSSPS